MSKIKTKSESLKAVLVLNTTDTDLQALREFVAQTTTTILYERNGKPNTFFLVREVPGGGSDV